MALTTAFLNTCRTAIAASSEWAAFKTAREVSSSGGRAARLTAWHATYSGATNPADTLRLAIRRIVGSEADSSGALGVLDRESAYATLTLEYVPVVPKPMSPQEESDALAALLLQEQLS